jgi:DNA helicase-2/ATP-dependent DNA helicase PcrA
MDIEKLIENLNEHQRNAVTFAGTHALVIAGAGTGKTRTIIARAACLIHSGSQAERIQILTFTRRSASEIVERVKSTLGHRAEGLSASTFHTWCMTLIRNIPQAFGCVGHTVIDRDDQLQLFKILRASDGAHGLPTAAELCDIYSYARNTRSSLSKTIKHHYEGWLTSKEKIAVVIAAYENKKKGRRYLDYDDILDVVATVIKKNPEVMNFIAQQYDYILVDEMQDTNALQWDLLEPLSQHVKLFCVGDDAQSIYGFRGADFRNIHKFSERIPNTEILKLEYNYRSTQEILDLSNWLLAQSPINYNKKLVSVRGQGGKPKMVECQSEWEEGRWISGDISKRHDDGAVWSDHMVLARSAFALRAVEATLLDQDIPYIFIGGTKLLESAHIRDLLSLLRVAANPLDELAWMRFLTLWPRIGDVAANRILESFPVESNLYSFINVVKQHDAIPEGCKSALISVASSVNNPLDAFNAAKKSLLPILERKYEKDWDRRSQDFNLVAKLVAGHDSILSFIEEYLLDPISSTLVQRAEHDDVVTLITIHSSKGTEKPVCYIVNVSPGSFPSKRSIRVEDEVEEERRVLYVAMTRAKNELILTRRTQQGQGYSLNAINNEARHAELSRDSEFIVDVTNKLTDITNAVKHVSARNAKTPEARSKRQEKLDNLTIQQKDLLTQLYNLKIYSHVSNSDTRPTVSPYFLNDLTSDLAISVLPERTKRQWVNSSMLTHSGRPNLDIDLS